VELEHPAVAGVGVEDELAVGESSIEVDGVLGGSPVATGEFRVADLVAFVSCGEYRW
jgi:hypothetical protein